MRERRYGVDSNGWSPSPRRRPLLTDTDFSPTMHRKLSQYRRPEMEEYSREANTARRIEERDYLDRDSNLRSLRFSEYDNRDRDRDRDRYADVGKGCASPQRIGNRDNFDRPVSYPNYEDGVSFDRSKRSYDEGSYPGDLSSRKFQYDYNLTRDSHGIGDTDVTRGREKDYYPQTRYLVSDQDRLPAPQYLDGAKPAPTEYESGGRMYSCPYILTDGGADEKPFRMSGGDGGSHISSVTSRYLNTDADKRRCFDVRKDLHLERKDGLHDREDHNVEKRTVGFHFQDRFLGTRNALERETYKFKEEDNLLSSRSYLKGDSDLLISSSRSKDYDTMPLDILKKDFPGYSPHISSSDFIQGGFGLPSQPVDFDGYSEKRKNVLDGTRNSSGLSIRLPKERHVGWPYGESARIEIDNMHRRNEVGGDYRDQDISRTDLLNRSVDECFNKSHMGDDGLWGQDPSSHVQSRNDKFDHLSTGSYIPNYVEEGSFTYGGVKPEGNLVDVDGGPWPHFERSDLSRLRKYDPSFGELYDSPRKRSPMADLSMVVHSERRLKNEHVSHERLYDGDVGIRISTDGNGARRIYKQVDVDLLYSSKKPTLRRSDYEESWREMSNDPPSSSKFEPHDSVGPHKSDCRDIKKRLGPVGQKLHVSQRLVDKRKPSVKERLTPARLKKRATPPWLKQRK